MFINSIFYAYNFLYTYIATLHKPFCLNTSQKPYEEFKLQNQMFNATRKCTSFIVLPFDKPQIKQ